MVNNNSPTLSTYVEKLETYAFILHRGHYSNFIFQKTWSCLRAKGHKRL